MSAWKRTSPPVSDLPHFGAPSPDADAVAAIAAEAPPLPPPDGRVVGVRTTQELFGAAEAARDGDTIVLADGVYEGVDELLIERDGVTLRGESDDRKKVILDAGGRFTKMLRVRGAKDLTVGDLTFRNSKQYGIFMLGDSDVQRPRIHNVKFHNIWVRAVKSTKPDRIEDSARNLHSAEHVRKIRPTGGSIRHCLFVNDTIKPFDDDGFNGDYVSGIDMMWLKDWVVADNVFVGIRGKNGYGRGAIFIWVNSEDVVAERNVIVNCDRGICFGNPSGDRLHMTGGIVRNNFIVAGVNLALEMGRTRRTNVLSNTVWSQPVMRHATIDFYQGSAGGTCFNNLLHNGRIKCPKNLRRGNNLIGEFTDWFADTAVGDLHLTGAAAQAVGAGVAWADVPEDFDRRQRKDPPNVGADETR